MRVVGTMLGVLVLCTSVSWAETRVVVRADGTKLITNLPEVPQAAAAPSRAVSSRKVPKDLSDLITQHSRAVELDPDLVRAVVRVESDFNPRALSHKGAMGLMQLMPDTARGLSVADPYDPAQNLAGGTQYLRDLVDRFDGSLELALAGYNAGPEAVKRYGGIPPYRETRDYVQRVMDLYGGPKQVGGPSRTSNTVSVERSSDQRLVMTNTHVSGS